MAGSLMMKTDQEVRRDVEAELLWNPEINASDIAVKVLAGVVTLVGFVRSFYEKHQAEVAAKRVRGVAALANDIEVRHDKNRPTDADIAHSALAALQRELPMAHENIRPVVHEGRLFLEGTVSWNFQRERAEAACRNVRGILGLRNSIAVKPNFDPSDIRKKIEDAFRRSAEFDSQQVTVESDGSEVTLRGEVRSWAERDQAQATAWSAPGVIGVHNQITVRI